MLLIYKIECEYISISLELNISGFSINPWIIFFKLKKSQNNIMTGYVKYIERDFFLMLVNTYLQQSDFLYYY